MTELPASEQIDNIIKLYGGWKGDLLSRIRSAILAADPDVVEQVKWKMRTRPEGLPVWFYDGNICLAETFKDNIKLVFVKGAFMTEMQHHFNARLKSSSDRAIEYHEGDSIDDAVLKTLVTEAVRLNVAKKAG
jgi:hypothetical protein